MKQIMQIGKIALLLVLTGFLILMVDILNVPGLVGNTAGIDFISVFAATFLIASGFALCLIPNFKKKKRTLVYGVITIFIVLLAVIPFLIKTTKSLTGAYILYLIEGNQQIGVILFFLILILACAIYYKKKK